MVTVEALRQTGGFRAFSDRELELLLGAAVVRAFAPGEVLCHQGMAASSCFILVSGVVHVVKLESGGERLLTRLEAGTIAGQLALIDRTPRIATLRAATELSTLELSRDVFEHLIASASPLGYRFQMEVAIATGRQLREADRRLAALLDRRRTSASADSASAAELQDQEREALQQIQDPVRDIDIPYDIVEITPEARIRRR